MSDDAGGLTPERRVGIAGWIVAIGAPLALSGIMVAFRGEFRSTDAALVLVLAVLAAALIGGRRGGIAAAIVAAASFDFFFTKPYYSFTINSRDDVETTIVLLVVGLVVGELVVRARQSRLVAEASRREVHRVRRVAEVGAGGGTTGRLVDVVRNEVVEVLRARGARFERPPFRTALPQLGHGSVTVPADESVSGLPPGPRNEVELPVYGHGRAIGRLVLVFPVEMTGVTIPPEDRALAVALVDQLGVALATAAENH
jgi:uncharacterized protein DUF4118